MVKLGLRRSSTRSRASSSRRSSEDSAMAGGSVHSRHSDYSDGSFPSVNKSVASGRSGRSSLRSSIVSLMSLDTIKASNNGGGSKRDLFKSTGKMSSFRKSFKKKSGKRSSGEEKISLQLEQGDGQSSQYHVMPRGGGARGRRQSATPTVLTMGTAASAALAAADAGDGPVSVALLKPGSGRRASATRAGGVRRTTLGSIPDGIDFIEDPDAGDGDDHTVGDKSNCSDLSGLTGLASSLEPNQAGDDNSHSPSGAPHQPHHRRGGTRRGSVEISRPAAQGRRRSSLCRIPDGITLVHMSTALAELDMSGETALDDSLGNMGASASGGLNLSSSNGLNLEGSSSSGTDLAGSKTKMTIEEEASNPIKEEEEESQEESDQEDPPTEEVKKSSAVVSALLSMDHRLKAEKVAQRRALFQDPPPQEQDPRLAPPAFPALAEFVATLSKNKAAPPPVNVISFPSGGEPSRSSEPRSSPREEEEEMVRAKPLRTSGSALDRLLQNLSSERSSSPPPAKPEPAAASPAAPETSSSSLSAALDRIQASRSKSSGGPSALDRLLEDRKKPSAKGREGGGMSALDRLLVQPASQPSALSFLNNNHARPAQAQAPPPESARPQAPPSTPASATLASSAIDRILQSRTATTKAAAAARSSSCGEKMMGLTAMHHHPIGGGIPGAFGNSAPRTLSSQSERRGAPAPKKARSA